VIDIAPRHRSIFERAFATRVLRGIPNLFLQLWQVAKALPRKNVLALHVITTGHYALARDIGILLYAKLLRRRSVLHIRSGRVANLLSSSGIEPLMFRLGLRVSSHVIAIDEATARAIRKSLPSVAVSRVPNCIDFSELPKIPAQKAQMVLFVGWVLPEKGVEELLAAWARISRPDWSLKIVGPYLSEYAADLKKRYDFKGVELVGECENSQVLREMARASILCLPSYTEGFPNVILEAMALRCTVVATPVGAIPEMLADGAGVLVEQKDDFALAERLTDLIDDPVGRDRMANLAWFRAKKEYALDNIYQTYEHIWKGE
jgi:glycosyltransferase involved in cell wall biosynthesis